MMPAFSFIFGAGKGLLGEFGLFFSRKAPRSFSAVWNCLIAANSIVRCACAYKCNEWRPIAPCTAGRRQIEVRRPSGAAATQ
jgi:hypothetical protein